MWMVESNEQMRQVEMPTDGRKLRPLMPRHIKTTCCCLPNPNNILHWTTTTTTTTHHHPITCCLKSQVPLVSSRWNPTPEQLQALEEMYRRGIRTPSAEQIQQIAAKLTRFGKIQGKNVFYWFQNHKARERQKKRRQLESKPALSRRTYIENEHHNKLGTPSKCSTPSEDSESMQAAVIGIGLHHKISNETQSLSLSPNNPSPKGPPPINININPPSTTNNIFPALQHNININKTTLLQLFPLHDAGVAPSTTPEICHAPPKFVPNEFIEFLPTKN